MALTCPRCGWSNVRRSQMSGLLDNIMRVFAVYPYRCRCCRDRFYQFDGFQNPEDRKRGNDSYPATSATAPDLPPGPAAVDASATPQPEETPILCRLTFHQAPAARVR